MKTRFSRSLKLERFEPRCVFNAYAEFTPKIDPGASAAAHAAHFVQYNSREEISQEAAFKAFSSRAAVDAKLAELVSSYWDGLLGKPVAEVQAVGRIQRYGNVNATGYQFNLSNFEASTEGQVESNRLAKTDDGYIYLPSNSAFTVVDAQDPTSLASKHITAVSESRDSILLTEGDRLIRLSRPLDTFPNPLYGVSALVYRPTTRVEVFDITDRLNPVLTGGLTLDGDHVSSAVRNGRLTLVQFSDLNLVLPQPATVTLVDGTEAFESTADYLARNRDDIYAAVIPNYQPFSTSFSPGSPGDIGDWQDMNIVLDTLERRTSIVTIDITGQPAVVDSELVLGLNGPAVYMGTDNVYLIKNTNTSADIYRFGVGLDGSVEPKGQARLVGAYVNTENVSEYDGVLRVLAGPNLLTGQPGPKDHSSILLTIGETAGQWRVQGQVQIASSLRPKSIHFDGPQAVVLTGENYSEGRPATNYIVSLDLSDPTNPRKLHSSQIPGFSTYLKQIDDNHWIGLRYGSPGRVVTLYSSTPDQGLKALDSWTDTTVQFNPFGADPNIEIDYDFESGLVTIDGGTARSQLIQASYQPVLLRVKLGASDPLQPVSVGGIPEMSKRTFVERGHLFVVADNSVTTYNSTDLTLATDSVYLRGDRSSIFSGLGHRLTSGETKTLPVLGGYGRDFFTVTSVEVSSPLDQSKRSKFTILGNGMLQVQAASAEYSTSEFLTIRVRYFDGQEGTLSQGLFITGPGYQEPVSGNNNDLPGRTYLETTTPVKIWTKLQNEQGQSVSSLRSGDEAWVIVGAEDLSELRLGIQGGYFQVSATSGNVEIIGQPQFLGNFKWDKLVTPSDNGFTVLGAKTTSYVPNGSALSDIVRFKIRVTNDAPISITVAPTPDPDSRSVFQSNILVNMGTEIHSTANAADSILSTAPSNNTVDTDSGNATQDINGDGSVTALDVLQIINYINTNPGNGGESAVSPRAADDLIGRMDVSGDGAVTALDALLVINTLNTPQLSAANAEGEAMQAAPLSVDAWPDDLQTRKSRRI